MTIIRDLPFADYLALPGAHFSALKEIEKSPRHYLRANQRPDTESLRIGRATHALTLTPDVADVVVYDGKMRRGKEWDAFQSAHAGKTILSRSEAATAHAMRDAVMAHPRARALLSPIDGDPEVTVEWIASVCLPGERRGNALEVPRVDLACRARVDFLRHDGRIVEFKTARAAHPRAFMRSFAALYYHAQAAFYADGLEAATGKGPWPVHVIAVEKTPPHDVCVYSIPDSAIEAGRRKVDEWIKVVAECTRSGQWPGADGGAEVDMVLPAWVDSDGFGDVDESGVEEDTHGVE